MENASKALIIAGAILLVIAIIAIGIGIVNKTRGTIEVGKNQLSSMEIQMHNKQYERFESKGNNYDKSFEEVRELVRLMIADNKSNEKNRDNIMYLTISIKTSEDEGTAWFYIDDREGNNNEQKLKHSTYSWGANEWTIDEVYNGESTKDYVVNANKFSNTTYKVELNTDERGYINDIKITKKGNIAVGTSIN